MGRRASPRKAEGIRHPITRAVHRSQCLVFGCVLPLGLVSLLYNKSSVVTIEWKSWTGDQQQISSSCRQYRHYPWSKNDTRLPYLGDVFASHDSQWIYMIALNQDILCHERNFESDKLNVTDLGWKKPRSAVVESYRFMCMFPDNTHVLSESIPNNAPAELLRIYTIRCRIPAQYQHLVRHPSETTSLHFDLYALDDDLELQEVKGLSSVLPLPSISVTGTPKLVSLPVCHPLDTSNKKQHYNLVGVACVTSEYTATLSPGAQLANKATFSAISRVNDWIEYHIDQGMDQLIIFDNDDKPHGELEQVTKPYVEAGQVTYRWFPPLKNCYGDKGLASHDQHLVLQAVSVMSTLFRYRGVADFVAHMDIDEFFVLLQINDSNNNKNRIVDYISQDKYSEFDYFSFLPTVMVPCNGTAVSAYQPVIEKWMCLSDLHLSDKKVIMRPHRIDNFGVHSPTLSADGTILKEHKLNNETEGFLAQYHADDQVGGFGRDKYKGFVENQYTHATDFMSRFVERRNAQRGHGMANAATPATVPESSLKKKEKKKKKKAIKPSSILADASLQDASAAHLTIVIMSDRIDALVPALGSVVRTSTVPIRVIMIGNEDTSRKVADHFAGRIAVFETYTLKEVQQDFVRQGLRPIWQWDEWHSSFNNPEWRNENTVRIGNFDGNPTHAHELNHLRFYLPYMSAFKDTPHYFFMDDDVLVQKDLGEVARQVIQNLSAAIGLTCPCIYWAWNNKCRGFDLKRQESNIRETAMLFGGQSTCKDLHDENCVSDTFEDFIRVATPPNASKAEDQSLWNFGLCLIHKDNWQHLDLTGRYEYTMKVQYAYHAIPENSIAFGLGLPFLSFAGAVDCWQDNILRVVEGFGYIEWIRYTNAFGHDFSMEGLDVLHYTGSMKPWFPHTLIDSRMVAPWLDMMEKERLPLPPQLERTGSDPSLFLVISHTYTGSEWLMAMMDQHLEICATGEGRRIDLGFPIDSMSPGGVWDPTCSFQKGCTLEFVAKEIIQMASNGTKSLNGRNIVDKVPHRCTPLYQPETDEDTAFEVHRTRLCRFFKELHGNYTQQAILSKWVDAFVNEDDDLLICKCPRGTRIKGLRLPNQWVIQPSTILESLHETAFQRSKIIWLSRNNLWYEYKSGLLRSETGMMRVSIEDMLGAFGSMKEEDDKVNAWIQGHGFDSLSIDAQECYRKADECRKSIGKFLGADPSKFAQESRPPPGYSPDPGDDPFSSIENREEVEAAFVKYGFSHFVGRGKRQSNEQTNKHRRNTDEILTSGHAREFISI